MPCVFKISKKKGYGVRLGAFGGYKSYDSMAGKGDVDKGR